MIRWISPMLATLTENCFSDKEWIFEEKLDGIRCLSYKDGNSIKLFSRSKQLLNNSCRSILPSLEKQTVKNFVLDGEIVAYEKNITSFSKLQRIKKTKSRIYYCVFDLLYLNGQDLRKMPLIERKKLLKKHFCFRGNFKYVKHLAKEGEKYLKAACKKGWEGIVAKRKDSKYVGKRCRDWLKFKLTFGQELVIGGYTDPKGKRKGFGALLVGFYDKGKLKYAGKVGSGYDEAFLKKLEKRLKKIKTLRDPFADLEETRKNVHFVRPILVGQIGFTEWTRDRKLRHPRFLGLRCDKKAKDVVRERPKRIKHAS